MAAHLTGGAQTLLDEMVEVESGKATAHRPQLARAMALCHPSPPRNPIRARLVWLT